MLACTLYIIHQIENRILFHSAIILSISAFNSSIGRPKIRILQFIQQTFTMSLNLSK